MARTEYKRNAQNVLMLALADNFFPFEDLYLEYCSTCLGPLIMSFYDYNAET